MPLSIYSFCAQSLRLNTPDGPLLPSFGVAESSVIADEPINDKIIDTQQGRFTTRPFQAYNVVKLPQIPRDATGIIVPLEVAETMRRVGRLAPVRVYTPAPLVRSPEGVMYAPYLLEHQDLTTVPNLE